MMRWVWFALALSVAACTKKQSSDALAPEAAPGAPPAAGQAAGHDDASDASGTGGYRMNASAREAYSAGAAAFERGDLAGARAQFERAVQLDPKAYQAHFGLGVVLERTGEREAALSSYQSAVRAAPDSPAPSVSYALLLARQGGIAQAESFLNQQISAFPHSPALSAALAEVKSLSGDSAAAQRHAQEALKNDPDYRPAMVVLARDHYRNRRLDLAMYALKGILDGYGPENPPRDKDNAEALLLRALIYKEQGMRGPAIADFERAIALRPDLVEARLHLAAYLLEAGNATDAVRHLEAAVRYDSANVLARLNLGDAYRLLGRAAQAQAELEWVLKAEPSLYQTHYNLGLLYLLSSSIPGLTPIQAAARAIEHFEKYKAAKSRVGGPDDTDELITRAKTKKALIEAEQAERAAAAQPSP